MSTDQYQTHPEQQESITMIEKKDDDSEEPPLDSDYDSDNFVEVRALNDIGFIEDCVIPTRSYWLKQILDGWGSTDEEIKANIAEYPIRAYTIEVCGWTKGYGVILRDQERNPIRVISKAGHSDSRFYHELEGVSLGLKLAKKYEFTDMTIECIYVRVVVYVMQCWARKDNCGCPPRHNPENPSKKKEYCVECFRDRLIFVGEEKNVDEILTLIDDIFCDALELEEKDEGYSYFHLSHAELYRCEAVWHLANMGTDEDLRLDKIGEHDEIAELLYKEVYGHGIEEELELKRKYFHKEVNEELFPMTALKI